MTRQTGNKLQRYLSRLPLLAELEPDTRLALESICRIRHLDAGQSLTQEGDAIDYIGCVVEGILRMQKTLADGRQHIVGLLVEGDMFGRVFDSSMDFAIEASTDVEFCSFPRAAFEALLSRSPDLDRAVLLNTLNELDRARDWMIILSNQKVSSRLAGFFLMMCTRFGRIDHYMTNGENGIEVKIPISRTDLAHLLGTRQESISRGLHGLQDEGVIEILEPDHIRLKDLHGLADKAGEDTIDIVQTLREVLYRKPADL